MHIFSKKIVTVLSISLFAALLVSCGSAQNSSKANQIEPLPETLSIDDINGGVEENGYYLAESLDGDGTYCQYFWDVQQNYYEIGAVSFDSAKDFEYIDQSAGPDEPDETYSASEFYNALQDSQESYSPYYTRVLIEENQISNITRVFVP